MAVQPVLLNLLPLFYNLQVVTARGHDQAWWHLCEVTNICVFTNCNRLVSLAIQCCLCIAPLLPDPLCQLLVVCKEVSVLGLGSDVSHDLVLDLQATVKGCCPVSVERLMQAEIPTSLTCGWSSSNFEHVVSNPAG